MRRRKMNEEKTNDYINKQQSPQKEILTRLRKVLKKTLKTADEKMQWGVITFDHGKFYLAALKGKVHIGFAITGLSKEEISSFEGTGKTMRHIKIFTVKDIDEVKIANLIRLVERKAKCVECKK